MVNNKSTMLLVAHIVVTSFFLFSQLRLQLWDWLFVLASEIESRDNKAEQSPVHSKWSKQSRSICHRTKQLLGCFTLGSSR